MDFKKCAYSFALKGDEKPLELIRTNSLGMVSSQFSPFLIVIYILSLTIPLLFGETGTVFLVIWVVVMTAVFTGLYAVFTSKFRYQEQLLEQIERDGIAVSADIVKREKILQHGESLLEEVPYFLVTFHYHLPQRKNIQQRIANVSEELYGELSEKDFIQIRFHKSNWDMGILEGDMQRYLKQNGKGLYD